MTRTVASTFFFLFSAVFMGLSLQYPLFASAGLIDAGFFPAMIAACLVALSAANLFRDWRAERANEKQSVRVTEVGLLLGMIVGYLVLMYLFGTLIPTFVFSIVVLAYFNRRAWLKNLMTAAVLATVVFLVFAVFFDTSLPQGVLPVGELP